MKLDLLNHPTIRELLDKFPRFSEKERYARIKQMVVNKTFQEMLKREDFRRTAERQKFEGTYQEFETVIKDHLASCISINKVDYEVGFVEVINKKNNGIEERITLDLKTLQ